MSFYLQLPKKKRCDFNGVEFLISPQFFFSLQNFFEYIKYLLLNFLTLDPQWTQKSTPSRNKKACPWAYFGCSTSRTAEAHSLFQHSAIWVLTKMKNTHPLPQHTERGTQVANNLQIVLQVVFFIILFLVELHYYAYSAFLQWPSATYRKWGDPWWLGLQKLKFTCLWR